MFGRIIRLGLMAAMLAGCAPSATPVSTLSPTDTREAPRATVEIVIDTATPTITPTRNLQQTLSASATSQKATRIRLAQTDAIRANIRNATGTVVASRSTAAARPALKPTSASKSVGSVPTVQRPTLPAPTWTLGPVVYPSVTFTPAMPSNCDPAYPTVCIPSPPPDLDCKDIPYRKFTVLPPDPHGLDGRDGDGIGCES